MTRKKTDTNQHEASSGDAGGAGPQASADEPTSTTASAGEGETTTEPSPASASDSAAEGADRGPVEPAADAAQAPGSAPPPGRSAGRLALVVALLALALAAGAGGYGYLQLQSLVDAQSRLAERSALQALADEQQSAVGELNGRISNLNETLEARLQSLARLENRMADQVAARQALADRVDQLYRRMQSETDDWRIAEAAYLGRMAVHRVEFNDDIAGALEALEAADILLAGLGGSGIDRREAIAEAVDQLLAVDRVDQLAIDRDLDRVAGQLDDLPLAAGIGPATDAATADADADAGPDAAADWRSRLERARDRLLEGLGGLVTVSRDRQVEPLPEPESRFLLQQNLLLQIETARLAALRGQTQTYQQALERIDAWVAAYFDSAAPAVAAVRERLKSLAEAPVAVATPAIADTLAPLLEGGAER